MPVELLEPDRHQRRNTEEDAELEAESLDQVVQSFHFFTSFLLTRFWKWSYE